LDWLLKLPEGEPTKIQQDGLNESPIPEGREAAAFAAWAKPFQKWETEPVF
jgi:hypothetical protein